MAPRRTTVMDDAPDAPAPAFAERPDTAPCDRSAWLLSGPLTAILMAVAAAQFATWLPHYLTWPYWADHDVFATAARAWTQGALPYRDMLGNNFPGSIYLFLALGELVGWGRPWALFAFDAGLLLAFVAAMLAWSRARFGALLPGIIGALGYTSYAMSLDYCHAAQRDWHGPAFLVLALLVLQTAPRRTTAAIAGLLASVGLSIRPQTLLLVPALASACWIIEEREPARSAARWLFASLALGTMLLFAPLVWEGVLDDLIAGVRLAGFGGAYSRVTPWSAVRDWFVQASAWRWLVLPAAILALGRPWRSPLGRTSAPWLIALACISWYKPLSPVAHSYLEIPLVLVASVIHGLLAGLILAKRETSAALRLASLLLLLGLGDASLRPTFCVAGPNLRVLNAVRQGRTPEGVPPGYCKSRVEAAAFYPWADYRAALDYLRTHTTFETRVANMLDADPAITGMIDRLSVFPAEGTTWLRMVRKEDEPRFLAALENATDSVVVWSPEAPPNPFRSITPDLVDAVKRHYHPEAQFGAIAIWRRNPR